MKRDAIFDDTGTYRYSLSRVWDEHNNRKVTFVLLHPGTADEHKEDATTNKCILLAKRWGFGSLEIVTLFAYQANRCNLLMELTEEEAVGYDNDRYIQYALADADLVVAAWGENCTIHGRDYELRSLFSGVQLCCLGITNGHYPRHPLFVPYNAALERFHVKPLSFMNEHALNKIEEIEESSFDPYKSIEQVRPKPPIQRLMPLKEDDDCWLFCTMCYDDYPMHGEAVCHSCYERRAKERAGVQLEIYDYI